MNRLFELHRPGGGTDLAAVLDYVLMHGNFYADGHHDKTTIFVLTDGKPNPGQEGKIPGIIARATRHIDDDTDLSIGFIQIGANADAHKFLKFLDTELARRRDLPVGDKHRAKFDVVDTKTSDQVKEMGMVKIIMKSITS